MDRDDRVEPRALPATYEQGFVIEFLEVGLDYLLVTVNTATMPFDGLLEAFDDTSVAPLELLESVEPVFVLVSLLVELGCAEVVAPAPVALSLPAVAVEPVVPVAPVAPVAPVVVAPSLVVDDEFATPVAVCCVVVLELPLVVDAVESPVLVPVEP